jgi:transcriptional regulator with XRE-family HTH domain
MTLRVTLGDVHEWGDIRSSAAVLAGNIRAYRRIRGLDQSTLARRMQTLGAGWRQRTVSEVERIGRQVTAPELLMLTVALGVTIEQLLDPRGPERRTGPRMGLSTSAAKKYADGDDMHLVQGPVIPAQDVTALVCSHDASAAVEWDDDYELPANPTDELIPVLTVSISRPYIKITRNTGEMTS